MSASNDSVVWGIFDTRGPAETAIDKLWHAGFSHEQVGWAGPGEAMTEAETPPGKVEEAASKGAVIGSISGGTLGALGGALLSVLVPGIGPVLAGGILTAVIAGAAAGAAGGVYLGPFIAMGLSEQESHEYAQALREGRTIVAVRAGDRAAEATSILRRQGARVLGLTHRAASETVGASCHGP